MQDGAGDCLNSFIFFGEFMNAFLNENGDIADLVEDISCLMVNL